MVENKNWIKRHPVWSGIIVVFGLIVFIGIFSGGDNSSNGNNIEREYDLEVPTMEEVEIHDYYFEFLFGETDKLYDAEDAGAVYKYDNIIVTDSVQLEDLVKVDIAEKYGISEKELVNIYLKVEVYNN